MASASSAFPFEASLGQLKANLDSYVASVFSCLESDFLMLPRGKGFIEYATFEMGYETLKRETNGFTDLTEQTLYDCVRACPIAFIVLRSIMGFTPPEWAYVTSRRTGIEVPQGFARTLDRKIRISPLVPIRSRDAAGVRLRAMIQAATTVIQGGAPEADIEKIHRLDKADTRTGWAGVQALAGMGAPYAMLLYERYLGRPFAGHRDSVSEIVGDVLETAIEDVLSRNGITYRKTKRAEKIVGFDQAPDFIVPTEFNPRVVLEAKITEDDGTARDKVTRIQHLAGIADRHPGKAGFQVVACIAGRGFGVRREDMRKMLLATKGKVFTLRTLDRLVDCTLLSEFRTKR